MADPGPQCLMWLPILNKMAHVENGEFIYIYILENFLYKFLKFTNLKFVLGDLKMVANESL